MPATIHLAGPVFVAEDDCDLSATRSGGPGGQNVNKVATAIQLRVPIAALQHLPADAATRLRKEASHLLTKSDELLITATSDRSQESNREDAFDRLRQLVREALVRPKPRKKTKPTKGSVRRRLEKKKKVGEKKARRRKL